MDTKVAVCLRVLVILMLCSGLGCHRRPDDAEIRDAVRAQFTRNSDLSAKQLTVTSVNGVVTIAGSVDNESQRDAAGEAAGMVSGVKTVVNNLRVEAPPQSSPTPTGGAGPRALLSTPTTNGHLDCRQDPDGIYRCSVRGTADGVDGQNWILLIWVNPVQPAAGGWYLQRGEVNGVHSFGPGGKWKGVAQLGNLQYPPHKGDRIEVEVTIMEAKKAANLLSEEGVVVRPQPEGLASSGALAEDVVVRLQ
jgi:hypothetical protein